MRLTLTPYFALFFSAFFCVGCLDFGSSTGLASGDASDAAAGKTGDSLYTSGSMASDSLAEGSGISGPDAENGAPTEGEDGDSDERAADDGDAGADDGDVAETDTVPGSDGDLADADTATPDSGTATPDKDTIAPVAADPDPDGSPSVADASVVDSANTLAEPDPDTAPSLLSQGTAAQEPVVAVSVPSDPILPDPILPDPVLPDPVLPPLLSAALPPVDPARASQVFLNTDFESESLECWNGGRTATSSNGAGCGQFKSIGFRPFALGQNGIARSGSKAIDITYTKDEEAGGTNVAISADSVNVRAWYYFEPGFDFGQGVKIGRVSSFNKAKQVNDVDIILEVRSTSGKDQCGVTDMADVGLFFNGAPKGYDWGHAAVNIGFQRGRWYAVEYQVVLNTPGRSDGAVRLWVDGREVAARSGLNIRGTAGMDAKLNTVKIGGWYSNGAKGNACPNPAQPSKLHMDDVAIATAYVGLGAPNTVAAR